MTKINTNYKASSASDVSSAEDLRDLYQRIDAALKEMEEFRLANSEYLTEAQLVDLDRMRVTLKAEAAAISGYGVNGGSGLAPYGTDVNYWEIPDELVPGWNGIPPECINEFDSDESRIAEDPDKYGEYRGTVEMPNSGDPSDPTKIGFQMTDEMVGLYAESRGRDIIITIEYEDRRESWVIREGTVRPEPIIISATGLSHGVTIDCSKVIRVSDGTYAGYSYGTRSGFYIHGTEYDDIIRGTQADDGIVGWGGADKISGEAGVDTIFGDEYYEYAGQFDPNYGGNDEIKGGAGKDIIYGGGGLDTIYKSDKGESVNEYERVKDDVDIDPPDPAGWFSSPQGDWEAEVDEGMVTISNTSDPLNAGEINIDMPPGYNMAYADVDADGSLIITFVGDEGTFKVKIEDFFRNFGENGIATLNFTGSVGADIIDFSRVEVTSQVIKINGGDGEDIILGARNKMLSDGVDLNDMTHSQRNSDGRLEDYVLEGIFAYKDEVKEEYCNDEEGEAWYDGAGFRAEVVDGQIVITSDNRDHPDTLNLCAPDGYEQGYITTDGTHIYVILVQPSTEEDGKAKTVVFKIDASIGYDNIQVMNKFVSGDGEDVEWSHIDLIPVGLMGPDDYLIDGGQGHDIIFTQKGGKVASDSEDDVVEGEFDYTGSSDVGNTSGSGQADGTGEGDGDGDGDAGDPNGP